MASSNQNITRPSTATAFSLRLRLHYKAARVGGVSQVVAMNMLKLEENVFEVSAFLSGEECDSLIELSESIGFQKADVQTKSGRQLITNIRNNERVDYRSDELASIYWRRIEKLGLPIYDSKIATGLSPYFRFYKYTPGQKFNMHKDGRQRIGENETFFTFMVYLNDGCTGGETLFRQGNLRISPRKGSAIIFEHYLWHQGVEVESGVKYVLRSDIVYG